jgi:hypothetical protein
LSIFAPWLSASVNIAFKRMADVSPSRTLKSPVVRTYRPVPIVVTTSFRLASSGFFVTWLMTPPVEPRPNSIEAEPRSTSMRS